MRMVPSYISGRNDLESDPCLELITTTPIGCGLFLTKIFLVKDWRNWYRTKQQKKPQSWRCIFWVKYPDIQYIIFTLFIQMFGSQFDVSCFGSVYLSQRGLVSSCHTICVAAVLPWYGRTYSASNHGIGKHTDTLMGTYNLVTQVIRLPCRGCSQWWTFYLPCDNDYRQMPVQSAALDGLSATHSVHMYGIQIRYGL